MPTRRPLPRHTQLDYRLVPHHSSAPMPTTTYLDAHSYTHTHTNAKYSSQPTPSSSPSIRKPTSPPHLPIQDPTPPQAAHLPPNVSRSRLLHRTGRTVCYIALHCVHPRHSCALAYPYPPTYLPTGLIL
ncbi:hypothetical protein PMIN06_007798 [Paraphaeosphaeria minitans]